MFPYQPPVIYNVIVQRRVYEWAATAADRASIRASILIESSRFIVTVISIYDNSTENKFNPNVCLWDRTLVFCG